MNDKARLDNGLRISRPRKKLNLLNDERIKTCISKFDSGAYSRMQFLRAVSHSMGAHTDALHIALDSDNNDSDIDNSSESPTATVSVATSNTVSETSDPADEGDICQVCLLAPRANVALVPCGHSRFCASCADTVAAMGNWCPICRSPIDVVLRLFI